MGASKEGRTIPSRAAPLSIGILVFDEVEELDFVGPWEVFGVANRLFPGTISTRLVSMGQKRIRASYGLSLDSVDSIDEGPAPRLLLIPGGRGRVAAMKDERLLSLLNRLLSDGTVLASVCTGAFILAAAGLLDGKRATTHWAAMDELRTYAKVSVVERRFVDEGDVVTSAGISAGIDMSIHLIDRYFGVDAATEVAHRMEYPLPSLRE